MKFRPPFMVQTSPKHQENPSEYLIYRPLLQIMTNRPPCSFNSVSRNILSQFCNWILIGLWGEWRVWLNGGCQVMCFTSWYFLSNNSWRHQHFLWRSPKRAGRALSSQQWWVSDTTSLKDTLLFKLFPCCHSFLDPDADSSRCLDVPVSGCPG